MNSLLPIALTAVALFDASLAAGPLRDEIGFYIESYGELSPQQDPEVQRTHSVFERVRAVADKNSKRLPRLVVVNSRSNPWAIALPDGHVVMSKRAVSLCHENAKPAEIDARLAFVLGHELAHLSNDDFWHQEVYAFLSANRDTRNIVAYLSQRKGVGEAELAADDKGFIYAALAGYAVELLIKPRRQFFELWTRQLSSRVQFSHPDAEDRATLLRRRLQEVHNKLAFFHFGVRLSHFDYCDDGVYFFREFQKTFPGREVHNNLGFCYLQMARQEMAPERAYFYWMPLLLDVETRGEFALTRAGKMLKSLHSGAAGTAAGYLTQAVEHLQLAVAADPGYIPARLNLAITYLYLSRPHRAQAILVEARDLDQGNLAVRELEALALYEQSDAGIDLWPNAIAMLEKLSQSNDAPASITFNLARLLDSRPRSAQAREYWNLLARDSHRLPDPIRSIVCSKQTAVRSDQCSRLDSTMSKSPSWQWPLDITGFQQLTAKMRRERFTNWQSIAFDWVKDTLHGHLLRSPDGAAEILELDQFVQLQVLLKPQIVDAHQLQGYCPQPLRKRNLINGEIVSCGNWAALIRQGEVQELWWIAR